MVLPTRAEHYKDPLGVCYYRRLSLTENIAHLTTSTPIAAEQIRVANRRERVATDPVKPIPRKYPGRDDWERRVPNDLVVRQILPSYARHIARASARPGLEVRSVKVYRALHLITGLPEFRGYDPAGGGKVPGRDPYNASLYMPYFQGTFDRDGKLTDPTDPMLYWLVPINQTRQDWTSRQEYRENGGFEKYFVDYVSVHAGCPLPWSSRTPTESDAPRRGASD
jgi:hypothetical protein